MFVHVPYRFINMKVCDLSKTEQEVFIFCAAKFEKERLNHFKVNQKYNFVDLCIIYCRVQKLKGFGVAQDGVIKKNVVHNGFSITQVTLSYFYYAMNSFIFYLNIYI